MVRLRGDVTMTRCPARPSDRVTARAARCSPSVTSTVAEEGIIQALVGLDHGYAIEPGTNRLRPRLGKPVTQLGLVPEAPHRRRQCGRVVGRDQQARDTVLEDLLGTAR